MLPVSMAIGLVGFGLGYLIGQIRARESMREEILREKATYTDDPETLEAWGRVLEAWGRVLEKL